MGAQSDLIIIEKFFISIMITLKGNIDDVIPNIIKLQFLKCPDEDDM